MSELRRMIADSAERLFSEQVDRATLESFESDEFPEALWQRVCDAGFPMAAVAEDAGGTGAGWADLYPVLRGLGYWRVPLPLAETMIGAYLLSTAGLDVPAGPLALIEQGPAALLDVECDPQGVAIVDGEACGVAWARACAHAVLAARIDGQPSLLLLELSEPGGVRQLARENAAREPRDDLVFTRTRAIAHAPLPDWLPDDPMHVLGAMTRAAMMVGAMESVLQQSVTYANERVQFGKPIGRYQAIQQSLAVMAGEVSAARTAARVAFDDALGTSTRFDVAVAKIRAGDAAGRVAQIGHQVHGAIGFTREHTLHYGTRRLWAWRADWGTDAHWAAELGAAAIRAGGDGFWPAITQRALL